MGIVAHIFRLGHILMWQGGSMLSVGRYDATAVFCAAGRTNVRLQVASLVLSGEGTTTSSGKISISTANSGATGSSGKLSLSQAPQDMETVVHCVLGPSSTGGRSGQITISSGSGTQLGLAGSGTMGGRARLVQPVDLFLQLW